MQSGHSSCFYKHTLWRLQSSFTHFNFIFAFHFPNTEREKRREKKKKGPKMGRKPKHCSSFFKVLIGDFANKLRIPPAFVAKMEGELPKNALIEAKSGEQSWEVKIQQIGDEHCFTHRGWEKLVNDNHLRFGDFVVFRLISDSMFHIVTYGPSGCEKELNPSIKKIPQNPFMSRNTRSRKSMDSPSHPYGRRSSRGEVEARGWSASAKPTHLSFLMVLKKYNKSRLTVPKAFAVESGIGRKKVVVLKNKKGQLWAVDICLRPPPYRTVDFTAGWPDFRVANNIEIGDTCLFKFIPSSGNVIHVEVQRNYS
ncbi:unnamed protein product [Camellia sinensis]